MDRTCGYSRSPTARRVVSQLLPQLVALDVLQDVHPATIGLLKAVVVELACLESDLESSWRPVV